MMMMTIMGTAILQQGNKKLIVESNRERSVTKSSMITGRRIAGTAPMNQTSQQTGNQGSFRHEDDESARAAAQLLSANEDDSSKPDNAEMDSSNKLAYSIRHDSLALFFRHVWLLVVCVCVYHMLSRLLLPWQMYFLSSLRLRDICDRLHISRDLLCKIWTTFEHVITEETQLLKDRCIDQIILCCIFAVTRVASSRNLTFHEILQVRADIVGGYRHRYRSPYSQMYRMQPQSNKEIYRSMLIEVIKTNTGITTGGLQPASDNNNVVKGNGNQVNTSPGGTQRIVRTKEIRDDIARFYNYVFLPTVVSYVKRFVTNHSSMSGGMGLGGGGVGAGGGGGQANVSVSLTGPNSVANSSKSGIIGGGGPGGNQPHLSPMPARSSGDQHNLGSAARRISNNKNVFVSPAKTQIAMFPKRVTFTVNSSPSKELRDINAMIASAANKMKGGLSFSSSAKRSEPTFFSSTPNISVLDRSGGSLPAAKRLRFDQ